jgi:hypothetical protein
MRIGDGCVCLAVDYAIRLRPPSSDLGVDDPEIKATVARVEEALHLMVLERNKRWLVCDRPECLELAKKRDDLVPR